MRAVVHRDPYAVPRVEEHAEPVPRRGEVLLDVVGREAVGPQGVDLLVEFYGDSKDPARTRRLFEPHVPPGKREKMRIVHADRVPSPFDLSAWPRLAASLPKLFELLPNAAMLRAIPLALEQIGKAWGEEPTPFSGAARTLGAPSKASRYVLLPGASKKGRRGRSK